MPTTQEILDAARKLGDLIADHEAAKKLENAAKRLNEDRDAQRAMVDFNRHLQAVAQKEAAGRPIEVADKRKLDQLQAAVASNLTLQGFQVAQMDYLDLMRQVDDAITGAAEPDVPPQVGAAAGAAPGAGPIVSG